MRMSTSLRTTRAQTIADAFDAGASPGTLKLYTAPFPETAGEVTTQDLLGTLTLSQPCGSVTDGVLYLSDIAREDNAPTNGDAIWARGEDSAGGFVADFTVGLPGSGADIIIDNTSIETGGAIYAEGTQTITEGGA